MKTSLAAFVLISSAFSLNACQENSSGDKAQTVDTSYGMPTIQGITSLTFTKSSPESLIECQSTEQGDANCRLTQNLLVLAENPEKTEKAYRVSYANSCRPLGTALDNDTLDTMIAVKAQPEDEGDVSAHVYFNKSDSFIIRGSDDLRLQVRDHYPLPSLLEKGCGLTFAVEAL